MEIICRSGSSNPSIFWEKKKDLDTQVSQTWSGSLCNVPPVPIRPHENISGSPHISEKKGSQGSRGKLQSRLQTSTSSARDLVCMCKQQPDPTGRLELAEIDREPRREKSDSFERKRFQMARPLTPVSRASSSQYQPTPTTTCLFCRSAMGRLHYWIFSRARLDDGGCNPRNINHRSHFSAFLFFLFLFYSSPSTPSTCSSVPPGRAIRPRQRRQPAKSWKVQAWGPLAEVCINGLVQWGKGDNERVSRNRRWVDQPALASQLLG